jgi:hypothetical protein
MWVNIYIYIYTAEGCAYVCMPSSWELLHFRASLLFYHFVASNCPVCHALLTGNVVCGHPIIGFCGTTEGKKSALVACMCISRSWKDAAAGDLSCCQPTECVSLHKRQDYVKDESGLFLKLNSFSDFRPFKRAECSGNVEIHVSVRYHTRKIKFCFFSGELYSVCMTHVKGFDLKSL